MKISARDSLFIFTILAVALLLYLGTLKKLGTDVPQTATHLIFYQHLTAGGNRIQLEKGCLQCHAKQSLPATHPPKEECMVCHRTKQT